MLASRVQLRSRSVACRPPARMCCAGSVELELSGGKRVKLEIDEPSGSPGARRRTRRSLPSSAIVASAPIATWQLSNNRRVGRANHDSGIVPGRRRDRAFALSDAAPLCRIVGVGASSPASAMRGPHNRISTHVASCCSAIVSSVGGR